MLNYEHFCDLHILLGLACIWPYWNWCMFWLNLHNPKMCLCVIWWQPNIFVKVMFIACIVIRLLSSLLIAFELSNIIKVGAWEYPHVLDSWCEIWNSTFSFWIEWLAHLGNSLGLGDHGAFYGNKGCFCCCWIIGEQPMQV